MRTTVDNGNNQTAIVENGKAIAFIPQNHPDHDQIVKEMARKEKLEVSLEEVKMWLQSKAGGEGEFWQRVHDHGEVKISGAAQLYVMMADFASNIVTRYQLEGDDSVTILDIRNELCEWCDVEEVLWGENIQLPVHDVVDYIVNRFGTKTEG